MEVTSSRFSMKKRGKKKPVCRLGKVSRQARVSTRPSRGRKGGREGGHDGREGRYARREIFEGQRSRQRVAVPGDECEFTCRTAAELTYPPGTWHSAALTTPDSDSHDRTLSPLNGDL